MKSLILTLLATLALIDASAQVSLEQALDTSDLSWTTSELAPWTGQSFTTHDGVDAAQTSFVGDNQETWIEALAFGPGRVSFWWRVSSELNYDWLRFHIDGVLQGQISGEAAWQQRTYNIPDGIHVLRWRYIKDEFVAGGQDAGWVDEVSFTVPEGAPVIAVQPASQVVWEGADVALNVIAQGSGPLTHQWFFNATNPIANATEPTLALHGVASAQAGSYQVVVGNSAGSVTSLVASVRMTNSPSVSSALLFMDGGLASFYAAALAELGVPFRMFTDESQFTQAVTAANRASTLVIVDTPEALHNHGAVTNHIRAGGRALVQAYSLIDDVALASSFQVAIERRLTVPVPVHSWGGSPLFSAVTSPLELRDLYYDDAERLHVLPGGYGVAGYELVPTPGEAAIVIGNSGRTIVNGFYLQGAISVDASRQLARNQILFLTSPVSASVPLIKTQPRSTTVVPGATATLRVSAWGAEPLSYQWFKDSTPIPGETADRYTIAPAGAGSAGAYSVVVSNELGTAASGLAAVSVVTNGPVARILLFHDALDPFYPSPFPSALANLNQSYAVPSQIITNESEFSVALVGANVVDTLVVVDSIWTSHSFGPLREFVQTGGRAVFQYWNIGNAGDLAELFEARYVSSFFFVQPVYNWQAGSLFTGLPSPLAFNDLFNLNGHKLEPIGGGQAVAGYVSTRTPNEAALVVGNSRRTLIASFLPIEVSPSSSAIRFAQNELSFFITPVAPTIVTQPVSRAVIIGGTASFSVAAAGTLPLTYQWKKDGENLTGANSASYTISGVQSNHLGAYTVQVSNSRGSVLSQPALLEIAVPPVIIQAPLSQAVVVGGSVTFSVEISGNPKPFTYEWRRIVPAASLATRTTSDTIDFFTLSNVQPGDAAAYRVVVRNAANTNGIARSATLTVLSDTDGDGMPDPWEATNGLSITVSDASEDLDRDGVSNRDEYLAGTDPKDAGSFLKVERISAVGGAALWFQAVSNKTYTVQYSEALGTRQWLKLADVLARETNRLESVRDPGAGQRLYRLATPRQP